MNSQAGYEQIHVIPGRGGAGNWAQVRVPILVFAFFLWEGLITHLAGFSTIHGKYLVSALLLAHLPFMCARIAQGARFSGFFLFLLIIALFFVFVSFAASTFIFEYPARDWIMAQYITCAVLLPFALHFWGCSISEVGKAIFWCGLAAAVITIIAHAAGLYSVLAAFARKSTYEDTYVRIVILKNEIAFAMLYSFFTVFYGRASRGVTAFHCVAMALLFYVIAFSLESRLALAAVIIGLVLGAVAFKTSLSRKMLVIAIGASVAVLVFPALFYRYHESIQSGNYLEAANISIRLKELAYFWGYFEQTYGMGYGFVSVSPTDQNHAAYAAWRLIPGYAGFGVQDLGIFGSMVQFGYLGFTLVVGLTIWCISRFYRLGRMQNHPARVAAMAGFSLMIGFMISPWPMDFLTLAWTAFLGWTLVYMSFLAGLPVRSGTAGYPDYRSSAG